MTVLLSVDDELLERARKVVASGVFAGPAPSATLDLSVALWHVETWWAATFLQHRRLVETTSPAHAMADVALLVLALRNPLRSAHLAEKASGDERIREAILLFEARLAGLAQIRDVLEHSDEYAEGKGRFQRRSSDQPPGELIPASRSLGGFLLKVGSYVLGAGATALAAEELARAVIEVLGHALAAPQP